MIKYIAPEMEKVVVETADVVLASATNPCANGHDYVNGVCTKCGAVAETGDDLF